MPNDFGRSYRLGTGAHFVIEGDEYDSAFFDKRPKFVHYLPTTAVIGNVEFDHADIYPDLAAVKTAFVRLLQVIPRSGLLVAGTESPALVEILPQARCRVETFGLHAEADWRAVDVRAEGGGSRFRLVRQGPGRGRVRGPDGRRAQRPERAGSARGGRRGRRRAGGGARGARRRSRASSGGSRCAARSAASPSTTTSRTTRRPWPRRSRRCGAPAGGGRLVAVFEPRSYTSRTRVFQDDFARAFALADRVYVAAAHLPGKVPEAQRLSEADLVAAIGRQGGDAVFLPTVEAIVAALAAELRPGDRVAILSNGGFGGIHEKLLQALAEAHGG